MANGNIRYAPPAGAVLCDRLLFPKAPGASATEWDAGASDEKALQDLSMKRRLSFVYIFSMVCLGLCYGAQGPATLALAEQCEIVKAANGTTPIDASKLSQMGVATGADALAGILGTLIGGWCVDRVRRWHWVLCIYLIWQGLAFMSWTIVHSFPQLLIASLLWGFASTLPSFSTQAAMTWVWGKDVAPYMQLNNAGFGLGALVAPMLVSAELRHRNSFHYAYWGIGVTNIVVAFMSLPFPTPRAAGAASNKSAAVKRSQADLTLSINADKAPVGAMPFGPLTPLLSNAGITSWPLLRLFVIFYSWFFFYCATELGFSAWISPYASLAGLASEADAALLTTVYYGTFTVTRTIAAPLSAFLSSRKTLWYSMLGSILSLVCMLLLLVFKKKAVPVLWIGAGLFGAFEGPMWPAMLSLLSEEYGLELRATQTAMILVMAKAGIAAEQVVFSSLLETEITAPFFIPVLIVVMLLCGGTMTLLFFWALPNSGLVRTDGSGLNAALARTERS